MAKNEKFQSLVSSATSSLIDSQPVPKLPSIASHFIEEDLSALKSSQDPDTPSLLDLVASYVGQLGERIVLQRGFVLSSSRGLVCGQVYNNCSPRPGLSMGRYATLLHLAPTTDDRSFTDLQATRKLGHNVGLHIIGANPTCIREGEEEEGGTDDPTRVLVNQPFLLDEQITIGEMLTRHDAKVTKFVRYALGEL